MVLKRIRVRYREITPEEYDLSLKDTDYTDEDTDFFTVTDESSHRILKVSENPVVKVICDAVTIFGIVVLVLMEVAKWLLFLGLILAIGFLL